MYERFLKELADLSKSYPEAKNAERIVEEGYALMGALLPKYRALQGTQSAEMQMVTGLLENTRAYVNQIVSGLAATALSRMINEEHPPVRIYKAPGLSLVDKKEPK